MSNAEIDFYLTIERAMGLAVDATCELRAARTGRLPEPHRQLLASAIGKLEWAQQILFTARNDPWHHQPAPRPGQLELL